MEVKFNISEKELTAMSKMYTQYEAIKAASGNTAENEELTLFMRVVDRVLNTATEARAKAFIEELGALCTKYKATIYSGGAAGTNTIGVSVPGAPRVSLLEMVNYNK